MKYTSSTQKAPRNIEYPSGSVASAGPQGVALAPPVYGIDMVDREAVEVALELGQAHQTLEMATQSGHSQEQSRPAPPGSHADILALQRAAGNWAVSPLLQPSAESVPPIVEEVLHSPGQPLDPQTRAFMEPRFGEDFSQVRVHADVKATEAARAINALAYTVGNQIVIHNNYFKPETTQGKKLIAHELTHVLQQSYSNQMQIQRFTAELEENRVFILPEKGDTNQDLDKILCSNIADRKIAGRERIDVTQCLSKGVISSLRNKPYTCANFVRMALVYPQKIDEKDISTWYPAEIWNDLLSAGHRIASFAWVTENGKVQPVRTRKPFSWKQLPPQMGDVVFMRGDIFPEKRSQEPDPYADNFRVNWDHVGIFLVRSRRGLDYHLAKDGDENPVGVYHTGMDYEGLESGAYVRGVEGLMVYVRLIGVGMGDVKESEFRYEKSKAASPGMGDLKEIEYRSESAKPIPRKLQRMPVSFSISSFHSPEEREAERVANKIVNYEETPSIYPNLSPRISRVESSVEPDRDFWLSIEKQPHYGILPRARRVLMASQTGNQDLDEIFWILESRFKHAEKMRNFLQSKFGQDKDLVVTSEVKPGEHTTYRKMDVVPSGTTSWEELAAAAVYAGFWVHAEGVTLDGKYWPLSPHATGPHLDLYLIKVQIGDYPLRPAGPQAIVKRKEESEYT